MAIDRDRSGQGETPRQISLSLSLSVGVGDGGGVSQRLGPRGPVLVVAASRVAPQGIPGSARRAARDQRGGGVIGKKGTRVWRGVSGEMMMAARAVLSSCALSSLLLSLVSASRPLVSFAVCYFRVLFYFVFP